MGGGIKHDREGCLMSKMKIRVVYIPYARYIETGVAIGHITAKSFRDAIIKMLSRVNMYQDKMSIMEREDELGRKLTQEELIDLLVAENGDGCDYIVSIMNEDTEEVYMSAQPGLDEWSIK
jgi:hypothetical protein